MNEKKITYCLIYFQLLHMCCYCVVICIFTKILAIAVTYYLASLCICIFYSLSFFIYKEHVLFIISFYFDEGETQVFFSINMQHNSNLLALKQYTNVKLSDFFFFENKQQ